MLCTKMATIHASQGYGKRKIDTSNGPVKKCLHLYTQVPTVLYRPYRTVKEWKLTSRLLKGTKFCKRAMDSMEGHSI